MSDLNQCSFIGRLGTDPEIKSFASGGRVCNLRIAVGAKWKDKASGEAKERTEWISVTINSDGLVDVAERYLKKGNRVFVQGELRTRKWQDSSGADRYSTEIVIGGVGGILTMLDGAPSQSSDNVRKGSETSKTVYDGPKSAADALDDEIPF